MSEWINLGDKSQVNDNVSRLTQEQLAQLQVLIRKTAEFWRQTASELNNDSIFTLIYFFTVAEEKHSVLKMGNNSPVIALNQVLKSRNCLLSKDDLLWIKQNSSNRFLPNGSIVL